MSENISGKRKGFIQNVTPKKKTRSGGSQFHFQVQNSPTGAVNVLGFGDYNYQVVQEYALRKSPISMKLTYNDKYETLVFNEQSNCSDTKDVSFDFHEVKAQGGAISMKVDIATLNRADPSDKYYSVAGKIFLGPDSPKTGISGNGVVKEDNVLIDNSGNINIRIWEPLLKDVHDKKTYEFTHVKIRKFEGNTYITTCPQSVLMPVNVPVEDPVNIKFMTSVTRSIERFEQIGEIQQFFNCKGCKKKISSCVMGKRFIKCESCRVTFRKEDLEENVMVVVILDEGKNLKLTIPKNVLTSLLDITVFNEEEIIEQLMMMMNLIMSFNPKTNIISEINVKIEEDLEKVLQEEDGK